MTEREPSPAAMEKAREVHVQLDRANHEWWTRGSNQTRSQLRPCPVCESWALALDDFAAQRERAGLEKAASSVEGAPKGCTDFYATFVTRKEAASAIRALMVEPSEKETGR